MRIGQAADALPMKCRVAAFERCVEAVYEGVCVLALDLTEHDMASDAENERVR
jgi:hypothetical protein